MTELLDLSCPVVRRGAGLHPDQTGRQLLEERQYLTSAQLAANDDHTLRVDTMNLEYRLREIDANRDDIPHWMAPLIMWSLTATTSWHSDAA